MTFMTNDYLEYYLTLLGWIINNGIWNMISDTGLFAVPFAAIVMREWLKVRGEGADEGNKGVLSLARIETHIYVGYIVVALAGIPVVNVSFDTIEFDQARAQQCQYNLPAPADTGWSRLLQQPGWQECADAALVGDDACPVQGLHQRRHRGHSVRHGSAADANGSGQHAREQSAAGTRNR